MEKYKLELFLSVLGVILTVYARNYAVARRLSMGLSPSVGGEFLVIPIIIILYAAYKSDWSLEY